jgi:hypothetical protein
VVVCPGTVLKDVRFKAPVLVEITTFGVISGCDFPRDSLIDATKADRTSAITGCTFHGGFMWEQFE